MWASEPELQGVNVRFRRSTSYELVSEIWSVRFGQWVSWWVAGELSVPTSGQALRPATGHRWGGRPPCDGRWAHLESRQTGLVSQVSGLVTLVPAHVSLVVPGQTGLVILVPWLVSLVESGLVSLESGQLVSLVGPGQLFSTPPLLLLPGA